MKTKMTTRRSQIQKPQFTADVLVAAAHLLQTPEFAKALTQTVKPLPERRNTNVRTRAGTGQRGRVAGFYFPRTKTVKFDSQNVRNVFDIILKAKGTGITQKQIQDKLNLSQSTVWYALQQLRAANAVTYRQPESVAA